MTSPEFQYQHAFSETVRQVNAVMLEWFNGPREAPPSLNEYRDMIYLKNTERMVTHSNDAYRKFFADGVLPIGKKGDAFLHASIIKVSKHTDALMIEGVPRVELDHVGHGSDGKKYLITTYKRSFLEGKGYEPFSILGISRVVEFLGEGNDSGLSLAEIFSIYQNLSDEDKQICESISDGHSVRDIAADLELSTKAIDNHRKKIMRELHVDKPVEIVKLLVRFRERGFGVGR